MFEVAVAQEVEWLVHQMVGDSIPGYSRLHEKFSLGNILNPELPQSSGVYSNVRKNACVNVIG